MERDFFSVSYDCWREKLPSCLWIKIDKQVVVHCCQCIMSSNIVLTLGNYFPG